MKLDGNKKILLLGIILLIIAGIVIVALKGFNVSLIYQQHESINFLIGKNVDFKDIKSITDEVFKDKKVVIRNLELFNDSVNINVESITDEEKQALIEKINEKYSTEFKVEEVDVNSNSNIRIRDFIRPYIVPTFLSFLLILVYIYFKDIKIKSLVLIRNIIIYIALTEAVIASIVAITRIPISPSLIYIMLTISVIELIVYEIKYKKNQIVKE